MIDDRQFPVRYYMTAALPANLSGEGEEPRTTQCLVALDACDCHDNCQVLQEKSSAHSNKAEEAYLSSSSWIWLWCMVGARYCDELKRKAESSRVTSLEIELPAKVQSCIREQRRA